MTQDLKQAAQMALEALTCAGSHDECESLRLGAIQCLSEALTAPAQVPMSAPQATPALKRHALEAADRMSKYAAAPFFPDVEKRGIVRSTTPEWWDGLAELIEEAQPLIFRALRECTEPHGITQQEAGK